MSLAACARLVERGDPDRFRVAMAAPSAARGVLLPLYAFNLEIARATWVSRESLIVLMRLQWWQDAIEGVRDGAAPLAHEVAGPLGVLIRDGRVAPPPLIAMIEARRREADPTPLAREEVLPFLVGTAGELMRASHDALGGDPERSAASSDAGLAAGAASWLIALPALIARGRGPADVSPEALREVADAGWAALREARRRIGRGTGVAALRAASLAGPILEAARRDPSAILDGRIAPSEASKRARLLWLTLRGGW